MLFKDCVLCLFVLLLFLQWWWLCFYWMLLLFSMCCYFTMCWTLLLLLSWSFYHVFLCVLLRCMVFKCSPLPLSFFGLDVSIMCWYCFYCVFLNFVVLLCACGLILLPSPFLLLCKHRSVQNSSSNSTRNVFELIFVKTFSLVLIPFFSQTFKFYIHVFFVCTIYILHI